MSKLFRIKPLEKKSIEFFIDVYSKDSDGNIRGWSVTEVYRWGQGFRDFDDPVSEHETKHGVMCNPQIGWGCELEDLCAVHFEFDDSFTDEEKAEIESRWDGVEDDEGRWGTAWLYDGDHNWLIEEDYVRILGPVQIDVVLDEVYNSVVEENIPPTSRTYNEA
jgi:hypothetical protein